MTFLIVVQKIDISESYTKTAQKMTFLTVAQDKIESDICDNGTKIGIFDNCSKLDKKNYTFDSCTKIDIFNSCTTIERKTTDLTVAQNLTEK